MVCKYKKNVDAHHQMQVRAGQFSSVEMNPTNTAARGVLTVAHVKSALNAAFVKWFSARVDIKFLLVVLLFQITLFSIY